MKIKKILIGIVLGLSSFISQAASTDCRQLAEDGEVDCIKVDSFYSTSSKVNRFASFNEATIFFGQKSCDFYIENHGVDICYLQYPDAPDYPPAGRNCGSCNHNLFTGPIVNETRFKPFKYGFYSVVFYSTDPKKSNQKAYDKSEVAIYKYGFCPENMTVVDVYIDNDPQTYCKPSPIPKNTPTSCDTSCNASSGNVSVGN